MFTTFQFILICIIIPLFSYYRYVKHRGEKLEETDQLRLLLKDYNQIFINNSENPEEKGSNAFYVRGRGGEILSTTVHAYPSTLYKFGKGHLSVREIQNQDGTITDVGYNYLSRAVPTATYVTMADGTKQYGRNF